MLYRCNSELGLRQILCHGSRFQQYPHSSGLADRVYTGLIHPCFPAGGPYNVNCRKYGIPFIRRGGLPFIQGNDACCPLFTVLLLCKQAHGLIAVKEWDSPFLCLAFQAFGHVFGCQRSCGNTSLKGVMIRLVPHIFPALIKRERNSNIHQVVKCPERAGSLSHGNISIHTSPIKQGLCHFPYTVWLTAALGQFIIGLFV